VSEFAGIWKTSAMSYGYPNQGPPPSYNATFDDGEPLFRDPPVERYPSMKQSTSTFGAPPMGEPSEPSAHPDNKTAATQTAGPSSNMGGPSGGGYSRQSSATFENPWGVGGGLRRQSSGAYDAAPGSVRQQPSAYQQQTSMPSAYQQQTASQPGVAGTAPAGVQPDSPYVQTQSVPSTGTSR
jgi:hypothetical protein